MLRMCGSIVPGEVDKDVSAWQNISSKPNPQVHSQRRRNARYMKQFHALLHHTALREGRLHGLMVPCALASESSGLSVGCLRAVCTPVWQV
jgi:hypothetical protein